MARIWTTLILLFAIQTAAISQDAEPNPFFTGDEAQPKAESNADETGKPPRNRGNEIDANGDGKIDEEEREAMREKMLKKRFESMDKDGDGKLSFDEFKAGNRPPRRPGSMMSRHDKDGDGKLSDDEADAAADEILTKMTSRGLKGYFRRFDKDNDGKLNNAERKEAKKFLKKSLSGNHNRSSGRKVDVKKSE